MAFSRMKKNTLSRQSRFHGMLGYDVFISYTRRDARHYAHELASRLMREHDFVVFLDDRELEVGQHLSMLLRQVRRSRMLILLASPEVAKSEYVPQEVAAAQKRKRRIVPIDLEQTIAQGRQGNAIGGILSDEKWETEENGLKQGPSDAIVDAIVRANRGMRRRVQQRLIVYTVMAALLALTIIAFQFARARKVALVRESVRAQQGRSLAHSARVLLAREMSIREPTRARKLLEDERLSAPELRDLTWRLVYQDCDRTIWQSPAAWGAIEIPEFLQDGRLLTVSTEGIVRVVDLDTGSVSLGLKLDADGKVVAIYAGPESRLCTLTEGGSLSVYSVDEGKLVRRIEAEASHAQVVRASRFGSEISGAVFLEQGDVLATVARNGLRFWDLKTGREMLERRFEIPDENEEGHQDYLDMAVRDPRNASDLLFGVTRDYGDEFFSAHLWGLQDAVASVQPIVSEWEVSGKDQTKYVASSESGLVALLSSSIDTAVDSGDRILTLHLMDANAAKPMFRSIRTGQGVVTGMAVGKLGAHVVLAYEDGVLRMLDTTEGSVSLEITSEDGPVSRLAFDEQRQRLVMVTADKRARVIGTTRPRPSVSTFRGHWKATRRAIHTIHRLSDQRLVHLWSELALDPGSSMELLDAATGVPKYEKAEWLFWSSPDIQFRNEDEDSLTGIRSILTLLGRSPARITPDSEWLAALDYKGVELQDLRRALGGSSVPRREEPVKVNFEDVLLIDFAEASDRYALVRATKAVNGNRPRVDDLTTHETWTLAVGKLGAAGSETILWEGKAAPQALAFSPGGRWLAFADGKGPVRLWDASTNAPAAMGIGDGVAMRLAFAPDPANRLLILSEDTDDVVSLQVIEPGKGKPKTFNLGVRGAALLRSAGTSRAVVGAEDGNVVVVDWDLQMIHALPGQDNSFVFGLEVSEDAKTLLVSRLLASGAVRCTLADATFGHDIMELSAGPIGILGASFLAGDTGIVMIGADQRYHVWKTELPPGSDRAEFR